VGSLKANTFYSAFIKLSMVWAKAYFLINIQKGIQNTVPYHFNNFYFFCLVCDVNLDGKRAISCHLSVAAHKMYFLHMTFQMADIIDECHSLCNETFHIPSRFFVFTNTHSVIFHIKIV
jgi:hypothetical protein